MERLTLAPLTDYDIGAFLAIVIAFAAWRAHALTLGGALAAFVVGTVTFGAGGWRFAAILFAFFLTSVALSRIGRTRKRANGDIGKTSARDGAQVLANGGVATICAYLATHGNMSWAAAFAGAYAAATADTWGTEIGMLARDRPRSIVGGAIVGTGISGGITRTGTLAEFAGALLIALTALACGVAAPLPVFLGGVAGAFADSLLGATLQELRWCPQCERTCENEPHACGANTTRIRGVGWMSNDAVNIAATLTGAVVALALAR